MQGDLQLLPRPAAAAAAAVAAPVAPVAAPLAPVAAPVAPVAAALAVAAPVRRRNSNVLRLLLDDVQ